ncbi:MAG: Replicase polyprotein 1ab [Dactylosporangium sp.]|nr:Replicase polyprotein 1ab [Dactylosporangium sp.]NNJ63904.1 Replicase polyprotein 1ab [Dactylosporangium sp.]
MASQDPPLAEDVDARELAREIRAELRSLSRPVAETVARRLVAAGQLIDIEPKQALGHALAARRLAARIPTVREAVGLTAYQAGQWQAAISELRAYHRMAGNQTHVAILADCERALDRPERAIDLYRAVDLDKLDQAERIELLIVAAGARVDLKQAEAAVAMLQIPELRSTTITGWLARLRYAFADGLFAVGRADEAREWFALAAEVDDEVTTDAAERLLELDGVIIDDLNDEDDDPEEVVLEAVDEGNASVAADPAEVEDDEVEDDGEDEDEVGEDDEVEVDEDDGEDGEVEVDEDDGEVDEVDEVEDDEDDEKVRDEPHAS